MSTLLLVDNLNHIKKMCFTEFHVTLFIKISTNSTNRKNAKDESEKIVRI
jgi:hypothetical protein